MAIDALEEYLESCGIEVELLRKAEKLRLLRRWRLHQAQELRTEIAEEQPKNWDLFVFEKGYLPCLSDNDAEKELAKLSPDEPCYLIPSDDGPGLWCSKRPPIDLNRFCLERARPWTLGSAGGGLTWAESNILVFPENMDWTLAIHSGGCYLSRSRPSV